MSDRFVSGGTISASGEVSKDTVSKPAAPAPVKNTEWEAVQKELEAERKRREEARVKAASGEEEKSLFDVLEANKAAKQAAFEEQNKISNQFRALDDDEVSFLDDVRQKQRAEEERVRKETEDGLKAFRERQKVGAGGETAQDEAPEQPSEEWGVGRKRKRVKERDVKGVRRRVSESEKEKVGREDGDQQKKPVKGEDVKKPSPAVEPKKASALVDYGSDSDDD